MPAAADPPPAAGARRFEGLERIATVLSLVAIPVVLAVVGGKLQRDTQGDALRRDYVQLAVALLQEPDTAKVRPALRAWAIALLNTTAPVRLPDDAQNALQAGRASLPVTAPPAATPDQVELLRQLNAPARETRTSAARRLDELARDPRTAGAIIGGALAQLEPPALAALSDDAIVNVLGRLVQTAPGAWTDPQRQQARAALARLDSLRRTGDPRVGPYIADLAAALRARLGGA